MVVASFTCARFFPGLSLASFKENGESYGESHVRSENGRQEDD